MSMAVLSIDLEARLANLQAGLDKAARIAEKNADQITAKYNQVGAAAAGIGAALAGAFSVGSLVHLFRTTTNGLDALNDLKDATGASIENISALEDVALRTGTSFDSMAGSLVKFNKVLTDSAPGSQDANIFKQLGLDAQELRRIDPAEALRQTAVALAQFTDDGNKARVIQALFGKSVQEAAPFLKDLAEAGKLNAIVTTAQAQAAEDFNKQLAAFSKNSLDVARAIAGPLIGALNDFSINARQVSDESRTLAERMDSLFKSAKSLGFGKLLGLSNEEVNRLDQAKTELANIDKALQRQNISAQWRADLENQRIVRLATIAKLEAEGTQAFRPSQNYGDNTKSFGGVPDKNTKPKAPKPPPVDFAGTVLDPTTLAALKRLEDSDGQKIAALRLQIEALLELDAGAGGAATAEALRKIGEELQELDPDAKAAAQSKRELDALLASTPTAKMDEVLRKIALINDAFERKAIPTVEQWAETVHAVMADVPRDTAKALDEMSEFTKQFQRNVQDALGNTVRDTLRGDMDSIGEMWRNLLIDMTSQGIAADLGNRLFGDVAKGGSNGGYFAALVSLFGFAKGGAFGPGGNVMAFADGGVLTRATPFGMAGGRMGVAGEAGPEAVLPLRRGADGKLGVAGAGGMTVINNIAAGMTRGEVTSAIQLGMQSVEGRMMNRLQALRVI